MKTIRHICSEAEAAFKEIYAGMIIGKLEEVAQDWINGNERIEIVGYKIIPGDKVYIAVKNKVDPRRPQFDCYYILRFFPGGNNCWLVSQDLTSANHEKFVQFLLDKMK